MRIGPIQLAVALTTLTQLSHAHGLPAPPKWDYAVGPSLAYSTAPKANSGAVYGMDATLSTWAFWGGLGMRSFENLSAADRAWSPYVEAGFWLIVNVGGGYTFAVGDSELSGPHLFLGFPYPLTQFDVGLKPRVLFFEPYYRPTFSEDGVWHEAGVLLKLTSWSGNP